MAIINRLWLHGSRFWHVRTFCTNQKIVWDNMKPSIFPTKQSAIVVDESQISVVPEITEDLLHHLEQLSLVRFSDEAAVHHLRTAIEYANQLQMVNTDGVEPMYTVLEDKILKLRTDSVTEIDCREDILRNASKTVEEYFVAPPGNIPLEPRTDKLLPQEIKKLAKSRKV